MNSTKVRALRGIGRACMATLFCATVAACGSEDTGAGGTVSETRYGLAAEWLTDEKIVPSPGYFDDIDASELYTLTEKMPTRHHYQAGRQFGRCTIVYRSYGDGTYDVAIKPSDAAVGSGIPKAGIKAADVDNWISKFVVDCSPGTL